MKTSWCNWWKRLFKREEYDLKPCTGCVVAYKAQECMDRVKEYGIGHCFLPEGSVQVEDEEIGWKIDEKVGMAVYNPAAVGSVRIRDCQSCGGFNKKSEGFCQRLVDLQGGCGIVTGKQCQIGRAHV